MVLESFGIRVPTPCVSLSISFAFHMVHSCPSLSFKRAGSSSMRAVVGSMAAPENREALVVVLGWLCGSWVPCLASISAIYA